MSTAEKPSAVKGLPSDFVYAGVTLGADDKLKDVLFLLDADHSLGRRCIFKKGDSRVIGGVYTGARFDEGAAYGLDLAQWTGRYYGDRAKVLEFAALDRHAMASYKLKRLEANAVRSSLIDQALLPLREAWNAMRERGDFVGAHALEQAMLMSLHRKPRKDEEGTGP